MIKGKQQFITGGVLYVLADTLAAHDIGGFKVGVGFSLRKCRDCLATGEQISTKVYMHAHFHGYLPIPHAGFTLL